MVGTFQETLDSSSANWVRIKSMTDLRVLAFAGSCAAKYSSTDWNFGGFIRIPLLRTLRLDFSKQVAERLGPSTSIVLKGELQAGRRTEQQGRSLEFVQTDY